jgi:hypothetical protein
MEPTICTTKALFLLKAEISFMSALLVLLSSKTMEERD